MNFVLVGAERSKHQMSGDVMYTDESAQIARFSPRTFHIKFKSDVLKDGGFPLSV